MFSIYSSIILLKIPKITMILSPKMYCNDVILVTGRQIFDRMTISASSNVRIINTKSLVYSKAG